MTRSAALTNVLPTATYWNWHWSPICSFICFFYIAFASYPTLFPLTGLQIPRRQRKKPAIWSMDPSWVDCCIILQNSQQLQMNTKVIVYSSVAPLMIGVVSAFISHHYISGVGKPKIHAFYLLVKLIYIFFFLQKFIKNLYPEVLFASYFSPAGEHKYCSLYY